MERENKPRVVLAYQDKARRCAMLLRELDVVVKIQPQSDLPYSPNASTAIWVGTEFPYDRAIEVIRIVQDYYSELRYVALSNHGWNPPSSIHQEIFVGGSTEAALRLKLKAWSRQDFEALAKVKSQEAFHQFITARHDGGYTDPFEDKAAGSESR